MQWWACSSRVSAPLPAKASCERIVLLLVLLVSGLFWNRTLLHTAHSLRFKASGICNHVYGRRKNIFQVGRWRLFPWESPKYCIVFSFSRQYKTLHIHRYINKRINVGQGHRKPEGYLVKVSLKKVLKFHFIHSKTKRKTFFSKKAK